MDHLGFSETQGFGMNDMLGINPSDNQLLNQIRRQERNVKSENVSPAPYGRQRSRTWQNPNIQAPDYQGAFGLSSPTSPMFNNFGATPTFMSSLSTGYSLADENQPLSAASDAHHVDWNSYELSNHQYYGNGQGNYMAAPTSVSNMQRAASSSGAVSEYEHQPQYAMSNPGYSESAYAHSNADLSRPDIFRNESTSSFVGQQAPASQASYFPDSHGAHVVSPGLDVDAAVPGSTTSLSEIDRSSSGDGSPARDVISAHEHHQMPTIHGFSVEDAQKLAHPSAARSTSALGYDLLAQPASPWSHEIHGEILPAFQPGDDLVPSDGFEYDEATWPAMQ